MRIFEQCDVGEGEYFPADVIISFGNKINRETNKIRGKYLRIEIPWIIRTKEYVEYTMFEHKIGPCRLVLAWRTIPNKKFPIFVKHWKPIQQ